MPIKEFSNSSKVSEKRIDTRLFVHKLHLSAKYIEANIEENIDMKNQFEKMLPCLQKKSDAVPKPYVDSGVIDPSIKRNTACVDFNDKNLGTFRFVELNSLPAVRDYFTPKFDVDEAICHYVDGTSLLRLDPDEKLKLDQQDSIVPISILTSLKTKVEKPINLTLTAYMETVQINKIHHQYLKIEIKNFILN